jgi:hypothetical protein
MDDDVTPGHTGTRVAEGQAAGLDVPGDLGDGLDAAVQIDGEHSMRVEVGEPQPAVVPARPLGESEALDQGLHEHGGVDLLTLRGGRSPAGPRRR